MTTDDVDLQSAIAAEFLALADTLDAMDESRWDTPSLCEGWRVREVIAHATMAARYPEAEFMAKLQEHGFDFTALSNAIAHEDAQLPTAQLVSNLRSKTMHEWVPPGGGYHGALNHVVIHGLDATISLGLPHRGPERNLRTILDDLTRGGGHENFGVSIDGRRLEANDLDWAFGSGASLSGSGQELAVTLCGRALPDGRLQGTPLTVRH
ncbi:MAG: maleylpyruvate isomerase family mycothiol-dependent enzyme [Candidatus Dormiibacterota bacterium]